MTDDDRRRLTDMLIYARRAQRHLGDLTLDELILDEKSQDALERAIEQVGEAANKIDLSTRAVVSQLLWRRIVSTRHIIAHDYGAIDYAILVEIVREHLPPLITAIERLLAEEPTHGS